MTKKQKALQKKHGIPREFEERMMACHDVSTAEAFAAVRKYREEWEAAGKVRVPGERFWLKAIVHFDYNIELKENRVRAYSLVTALEKSLQIDTLYFARYTNAVDGKMDCKIEISMLTSADPAVIRQFCKKGFGVTKVEVEERGTGSMAHAYAYQMIKALPTRPIEEDGPADDPFLDVIHWAANMRGLDYLREARLFAYRACQINHQLAIENEKVLKNLEAIRLNGKAVIAAVALADKLKLSGGKGQAPAGNARGAQLKKLKRSLSAASRKGRGSRDSRTAGSGPR